MTAWKHIFSRRLRKRDAEEGQALVEFALVVGIFAMLLFALIQFGMIFFQWQQVSSAASEGARRAVVVADEDNPEGEIEAAVQNAAPSLDLTSANIAIGGCCEPGDDVTVTVTKEVELDLLSGFGINVPVDMESSRTARVA